MLEQQLNIYTHKSRGKRKQSVGQKGKGEAARIEAFRVQSLLWMASPRRPIMFPFFL